MSNETRKVSPKKTKLGLRHIAWASVVAATVLVIVALVLLGSDAKLRPGALVGGQYFNVLVADDEASRQQGLSGRRSIAPNEAMLFVFPEDGEHCFWMKDMAFSIDMVWLNRQREVVAIADNVSPATFPNQYCPPVAARYVLEFRAGTAGSVGLRTGDEVHLAY